MHEMHRIRSGVLPLKRPFPALAAEDLSAKAEEEIKAICVDVFKSSPIAPKVYSELADMLRTELDKLYGSGWNAVVGKSFGAYVTQKLKCYIYLSVYSGVSILLWKA